ncbi:MAG: DUF4115 domain-containing protein [Peptococcaceae bacterium]|jgi:transcriptional regulator with XRE-family HTH domain|nr:DUF4115 domain-containing protein [Peptococcaceae bacterium]MDH7524106.1 DUF4115 domain-containing protein [Peptococcaceae bacterium]
MGKIGETLRLARLGKGIEMDEAEKNTKIRRKYLEAMEEEEWGIFPGMVYLKGFLKTYARFLGLDENELLKSLEETFHPEPQLEPLPERIELPGKPRKRMTVIVGIIAVVLLVSFQYIYVRFISQPSGMRGTNELTRENSQAPQPGAGAADENATEVQPEEPAKQTVDSINLVIRVVDYKCWIEVRSGQALLFEGTLNKGEEKTFENLTQVYFALGNSGDVEVYINDNYLGVLGKKGEPVYKKYVVENDEIKEVKISNR